MPDVLLNYGNNKYKVAKRNNPQITFSNKYLTKTQAEKQLKAIIISENKKKNK